MRTVSTVSVQRCVGLAALMPLLWLAGACERQGAEPGSADSAASGGAFKLPEVDIGRLPEGLQALLRRQRAVVRRSPRDPDQLGALGALYYVHRFPEAAAACFARATELAPQTMHWWYYLALAYQRGGKPEQAVNAYDRAIKLDANYGPLYVRLAGLLTTSDRQRAVRLCRRALELNPEDPTAMLQLGLCEEAAGDAAAALEHIERALQITPDYGEAHVAAARILTSLGREEEAQQHLRATATGRTPLIGDSRFEDLLRNGLYLDLLLHDALLLAERGVYEHAELALAKARDVDPTGLATQTTMGMVRAIQGRLEEAAEHFRRVLEARPADLQTEARLADVLARLGKNEEAEAGFRAVLEQSPGDRHALEHYCDLLTELGRAEEAEKLLREAAARQPASPWIRLQLGIVLFNLNKDDEAREQLEACLQIVPDQPRARYFLGRLAQRQGDLAAATKEWERIIKETPGSLEAYLALAEAAMRERDFAAAERYLRDGLKHVPYAAGLTNGLAWILATSPIESQRNGDEAVRLAERACAQTGRSQHAFLDTLAAAYAEAGRFDDAVKTAQEAIRLAGEAGEDQAAAVYRQRLTLYEKHQAYRETR
jgi:tetratricopeptide (TPR) repeat protein